MATRGETTELKKPALAHDDSNTHPGGTPRGYACLRVLADLGMIDARVDAGEALQSSWKRHIIPDQQTATTPVNREWRWIILMTYVRWNQAREGAFGQASVIPPGT
jgi:hypothetical protein